MDTCLQEQRKQKDNSNKVRKSKTLELCSDLMFLHSDTAAFLDKGTSINNPGEGWAELGAQPGG